MYHHVKKLMYTVNVDAPGGEPFGISFARSGVQTASALHSNRNMMRPATRALRRAAPRSPPFCGGSVVRVPMVNVGHVGVRVHERLVPVPMAV